MMPASTSNSTSIRRPARTFMIQEKQTATGLEWRVLHGNRVVRRFDNETAADELLKAIFRDGLEAALSQES